MPDVITHSVGRSFGCTIRAWIETDSKDEARKCWSELAVREANAREVLCQRFG